MPQQLPSGRWRTRVRHPRSGKQVGAHTIIGGPTTHADEKSARDAENEAAKLLTLSAVAGTTLADFWHEWTTDPLWLRPAESTNIHNKERTQKLVAVYGDRAIRSIGDDVVAEWLKGGKNLGTVAALRALFNDARTAQAGRLVATNPFANLGLKQSKGRKNVQPPSQVEAARLIELADELTPPSFAAYLHTAIFEGFRPGEGDALTERRKRGRRAKRALPPRYKVPVNSYVLQGSAKAPRGPIGPAGSNFLRLSEKRCLAP